MQWFKFYGQDFITDPKMGFLSTPQRLIWIYLLSMASQSDKKDGILKYVTLDHLRQLAGITTNNENWTLTEKTLELFEEMKLITWIDENTLKITNYQKYQEKELTNAERQAKYRMKKQQSNEKVTKVLQQSNARIDKNRIEKKEIHKERNISVFLSYFNRMSGKKYEATDGRCIKLEARLKKYSMDQLLRASAALLKSPFHTGQNENHVWYATPDFLLRNDETVDKWLNAEGGKKLSLVPDFINSIPDQN